MIETKKCSKCGQEKSIDNFCKRKNAPGRYYGQCKQCKNLSGHEYYFKNIERHCKKNREYYIDNRETRLAYSDQYYQDNKLSVNKRSVLWAEKNPQKCRASNKKYRENNSQKLRAREKQYRKKNSALLAAKHYFQVAGIGVNKVPNKLIKLKVAELSLKRALKSSQAT